jgi:hypothetical protein
MAATREAAGRQELAGTGFCVAHGCVRRCQHEYFSEECCHPQWAEREAKKDLDSWEAMDQEDVLRDMRDLGL